MVRHTFLILEYLTSQAQQYIDAVRSDAYDTTQLSPEENRRIDQLITAVSGMVITRQSVGEESPLIGQTLIEVNLRAKMGASVIALVCDQQVIPSPALHWQFVSGDLVWLIGNAQEVPNAARYINSPLNDALPRT